MFPVRLLMITFSHLFVNFNESGATSGLVWGQLMIEQLQNCVWQASTQLACMEMRMQYSHNKQMATLFKCGHLWIGWLKILKSYCKSVEGRGPIEVNGWLTTIRDKYGMLQIWIFTGHPKALFIQWNLPWISVRNQCVSHGKICVVSASYHI